MNDQGKKSSIQTLAAGLLGFVGIVGLGSLVILHYGGSAVKAPIVAYAPVDADPGTPVPLRSARPALASASLGAAGAAVSSPAPLLPGDARAPSAAPASPAVAAAPKTAPPAAAAPKLVAGRRLDVSSLASSSASASVLPAPKPKAKPALARKAFFAPKLELAKNQSAVASSVHYGVSDRAELMGRAAGPVYNFSGRGAAGQSGQVAADNEGRGAASALEQVDAAQKEVDASDVPAAEKTKVDQDLNRVRETAGAAPAAQ